MGITVNSFTSVSLDPPLVLWCLDKKSDRYHAFTKARSYTVSILGTEHQDVSSRLAKQGSHSLDGIGLNDYETRAAGAGRCARRVRVRSRSDARRRRPRDSDRQGASLFPPRPRRTARIFPRQIRLAGTSVLIVLAKFRCHISFAQLSRPCLSALESMPWAEGRGTQSEPSP